MHFVYIICFSEILINCTSFQPGYMQPSSIMFTHDALPYTYTNTLAYYTTESIMAVIFYDVGPRRYNSLIWD
jgi:hypothetical protein